jgi:hypothetical protein
VYFILCQKKIMLQIFPLVYELVYVYMQIHSNCFVS